MQVHRTSGALSNALSPISRMPHTSLGSATRTLPRVRSARTTCAPLHAHTIISLSADTQQA